MKKRNRNIAIAFFLISGIIISVYGIRRILQAKQCKNWTVVKGVIMDSSITEISDLSNNKTTETSLPDIKYEYSFKGKTYFNHIIAYHGNSTFGLSDSYYAGTEDDILKITSKYPVNAKVDVYLNPEDPHQAILDTGLKLPVFMPFLLGVLLLCVATHLYIFGSLCISSHPNKKSV